MIDSACGGGGDRSGGSGPAQALSRRRQRRAADRRGEASATAGQAGGRRGRVGDRRGAAAEVADPGLQGGCGALGQGGVGAQHGQQGGAAAGQVLDLGAAVALGAFGGQEAFAGQDGEAADADDLGLTRGEGGGAALHLRGHGLHQDGGADGVDGAVGGDQQRRRGLAAHHLQGGQEPALTVAGLGQFGDDGGLAPAQVAQPLALGGQLHVIGGLVAAQGRQFAVEGGDLGLGVAGVGAQAPRAHLFVAVLGLKLFEVVLDRGCGGQAGQGDQDRKDGGAVHQSR